MSYEIVNGYAINTYRNKSGRWSWSVQQRLFRQARRNPPAVFARMTYDTEAEAKAAALEELERVTH
jgi:hypothetical protein